MIWILFHLIDSLTLIRDLHLLQTCSSSLLFSHDPSFFS
ncbi:hypothetical protein GLYMA_01G080750v4 [Glycine max]|nr:hypothetical protein GLYMA_01G080750v4 [Glycine max]KAH1162160.1 hypothetical protein GYH30_000868 [Glycine max]